MGSTRHNEREPVGASRPLQVHRSAAAAEEAEARPAAHGSVADARRGPGGGRRLPRVSAAGAHRNPAASSSAISAIRPPARLRGAGPSRPGSSVGYGGVPHDVSLDGEGLFVARVGLHDSPAPGCRYLPSLIEVVDRARRVRELVQRQRLIEHAARAGRAVQSTGVCSRTGRPASAFGVTPRIGTTGRWSVRGTSGARKCRAMAWACRL